MLRQAHHGRTIAAQFVPGLILPRPSLLVSVAVFELTRASEYTSLKAHEIAPLPPTLWALTMRLCT
jgi:hypothetical protein